MRSKTTCEIVQVQLAKSLCLPLLTYIVGELDISKSKVHELGGVCWSDAFRRISGLYRLESITLIEYFCGALDLKHYHDIQCSLFMSNVGTKVAYLSTLFSV